jgi:hypothetical protein
MVTLVVTGITCEYIVEESTSCFLRRRFQLTTYVADMRENCKELNGKFTITDQA